MYDIRRVAELTNPAEEPVSLADVKAHLRVTSSSDDTWLTAAIKAARLACEDYTHTVFVRRTFRQTTDGYWGRQRSDDWWDGVREMAITELTPREIELLRPPLVSVQSVTVFDDSDQPTVVASTSYYVDTVDQLQYGRVVLRRGQVWPVVLRVTNGFQIDFTAGFSADANGVPADIKSALLMVVAWLYENRGDCGCDTAGAKSSIAPSGAAMLLDSYRMLRF